MICQYGSLEQRKLQIPKQDDGQYYDFQFPPQVFKNKRFKSGFEVLKQLIRGSIKAYFRRGRLFLREDYKHNQVTVYIFKCKYRECSARLYYTRKNKQSQLVLLSFKNLHCHKKSKDPQKAKRQQVNSFILNLSAKQYLQFRGIRRWMEKFDLSLREALYIVDQLYWSNNTQNQILTRLSYDGNCVRRYMEDGITMLIYLRTNSMKYNYLQYGESVTVQLNHQTLRKPTPFGNKYAVVHFYGQDQNLRLILFSVAVIAKESVENFKKLFQFFFENTCDGYLPISLITDEIKTMTTALQLIKKQRKLKFHQNLKNKHHRAVFNHLFSWKYVVDHLKPNLHQIKQGKTIMQFMCRSAQQFHQKTYITLLKQIKRMSKGHQGIFKQFLRKQQNCCVRRMPPQFCGLAITTIFSQEVDERVKTTTVYRVHTGRLFYKLIQIQKILQRQINKVSVLNTGIIKHCPAQINIFQNKLQARIMGMLVQSYMNSKQCKKQRLDKITFKIIQKNGKTFICRFSIEYDHWECDCRYLYLVGLPCMHLISIILDPQISGSLIYYINSRWIHEKQEIISQHAKPFITNKRRRP